jgi:hypothetical protein
MSGSIGGLLNLIDQAQQQNSVQQPPVAGLLGSATQLLPTDPFAAQRAAQAAQGPAAGAPGGPQAPGSGPMWGAWSGFGGTPSPYKNGSENPFAGPVPADPNPGHMSFAQAQSQAALPGQNPFPGVDPSHPLWQQLYNEYTNMGQTDPRQLFAQIGQRGGGGGSTGNAASGGGQGQDASGQW